jgi:hypothetical protein
MRTSTSRKDRVVGRARTSPSSSSHEQQHLIHDSIRTFATGLESECLLLFLHHLPICSCIYRSLLRFFSEFFLVALTFGLTCAVLDSVARSWPTLTW